jgi:hypothetical protein
MRETVIQREINQSYPSFRNNAANLVDKVMALELRAY